jgi:monoamine oxidase
MAQRSAAQDILAAPFVALSLAYWSPVYAAQAVEAADRRATARENGPLVAGLKLGEAPPGGEAEFRRRTGVRWHQDPDTPGYAVVTLDLGADHGRERRFTTFGVRDGRVEWVGLADRGLCQDAERRPSAARKGCTETGHYNP